VAYLKPALFRTVVVLSLSTATWAFGQELPQSTLDFPDSALDQEQWQRRVEDARRKSAEFVAEARSRLMLSNQSNEDDSKDLDDRLINDPSLQQGDIVSTTKGFFVFVGRGDGERQTTDFVPAPQNSFQDSLARPKP
jgi:hypothetical protein